jgi:hypothetical protein
MATTKKAAPSDDKIVKDVIKKYGSQIDLKAQPYVLTEILRTYGRGLDDDGGLPPGGTPPPPPPGPAARRFDNEMLLKEIQSVGRQVKALSAKIAK